VALAGMTISDLRERAAERRTAQIAFLQLAQDGQRLNRLVLEALARRRADTATFEAVEQVGRAIDEQLGRDAVTRDGAQVGVPARPRPVLELPRGHGAAAGRAGARRPPCRQAPVRRVPPRTPRGAGAPLPSLGELDPERVTWFERSEEQRNEVLRLLRDDGAIVPVFQPIVELCSG
jgi:hypothetical protein